MRKPSWPSNSLKGVIFDLDGVLIDSSPGVLEATNYALGELGLPARKIEEIRPFIGSSLSEMFAAICDVPADEMRVHFQKRGREIIADKTIVYPFAESAMKLCRQSGLAVAVGTTKTSYHVERIVKRFKWEELIDVTACGDEATVKPAPDIFLLAAKKLNVTPSEVVVVGDTINDFYAARAAGMRIVMVESEFGDRAAADKVTPDWRMSNVTELGALLENLLGS